VTLISVASSAGSSVCIHEANPSGLTVARGHYSMPGVPTLTISASQIASGDIVMSPVR
jgi:hypothetical protein